jgi:hypothetical protein
MVDPRPITLFMKTQLVSTNKSQAALRTNPPRINLLAQAICRRALSLSTFYCGQPVVANSSLRLDTTYDGARSKNKNSFESGSEVYRSSRGLASLGLCRDHALIRRIDECLWSCAWRANLQSGLRRVPWPTRKGNARDSCRFFQASHFSRFHPLRSDNRRA